MHGVGYFQWRREEKDGATQGEMEECGAIITREHHSIHKRKRKTGKALESAGWGGKGGREWHKAALTGPNVST